jgi:ADP-heptose:LPS heptosyltransferase
LVSISEEPGSTCDELLGYCLRGEPWPAELLDRAIAEDDGRALLSVVVERLGDLFEPRLCDTYATLFTQVMMRVCPELAGRIRRIAEPHQPPESAKRVYVLSRITLGADVAVTSVLLDAAKRRYPRAEIVFVGPRKSYELFEADSRVRHFPAPYARGGSLRDRLRASAALLLRDGIVIDPDSRLTQLGLIPVCDDDRDYFLFESRSFGGDGGEPLPVLAARWAHKVFGVEDAKPYIAPRQVSDPPADITVSLGVGENPAKRIGGEFEHDLVRLLAETGASVLVDRGGSAEERERVERVLLRGVRTHDGAFAPFAAQIARSRLYVGYDSAGGHVASACGVPLISVFRGFVSERMFQRWRPSGTVIRADRPDVLGAVRHALTAVAARR